MGFIAHTNSTMQAHMACARLRRGGFTNGFFGMRFWEQLRRSKLGHFGSIVANIQEFCMVVHPAPSDDDIYQCSITSITDFSSALGLCTDSAHTIPHRGQEVWDFSDLREFFDEDDDVIDCPMHGADADLYVGSCAPGVIPREDVKDQKMDHAE